MKKNNIKPKVYLSKSKSGSFDDIVKTREYCRQLGFDLLEFEGGEYNTKKLDSCDYLLVLPPSLEGPITIGKGQYTELKRFLSNKDNNNLFIISDLSNKLYIDELISSNLIGIDWKTQYVQLITNNVQIDITNFGICDNTNIIDDKYKDTVSTNKVKPMLSCINLFK